MCQNYSQKHVRIILDSCLSFEDHFKTQGKINKTLGLLRKLQNILSRKDLLTLCKSSINPDLEYGDKIYDNACNSSFHERLERLNT